MIKKTKRRLSILLAVTLALSLSACGDKEKSSNSSRERSTYSITGTDNTRSESTTESGSTDISGNGLNQDVSTEATTTEEGPGPAQTLGNLADSGYTLYIEEGTFGDKANVTIDPVSEDISAPEKYKILGTPVSVSCDEYNGTFFATDVILTVPLPAGETELSRYVFVTRDEYTGKTYYLNPDKYDLTAGTMQIALPHFSPWWGGELTEEEQIDAFLDNYCTKQAVANGKNKKAASELEPYVRAKAEALGLTKQATEDLVQSTVNYLGGQVGGKYGGATETATKAITAITRGYYDDDADAAERGLSDAVCGAMKHCWDDMKYSERFAEVTGSESIGGAAGVAVNNASGLGALAGYIVEGDTDGAKQELSNILQSIHPSAEFATKGTAFIASSVNLAFTNWKSNQVEELYKVYRDGKEQKWFGNEVIARDKNSFFTYLNDSSGFTLAKGVKRFMNLDNIQEICDRYGWSFKSYSEMDEHYRQIFEQRMEESLIEYFELRIEQEAEAEKLKEVERQNIESMLRDYGVLKSGNYKNFFGENEDVEYDITRRLERLVNVRNFLTQYVDEKAMKQSIKDGGNNWGDVINWWVMYADQYPKDVAIDKLLVDLKESELLKAEYNFDALPELADFIGTFNGDISIDSIHISEEAFESYKASMAEGVDLGDLGTAKPSDEDMANISQADCDEELNAVVAEGGFGAYGEITIAASDASSGACTIHFTYYSVEDDDDGAEKEVQEIGVTVSATYADGFFTLQAPHSGTLAATLTDNVINIHGTGVSIGIAEEDGGMIALHTSNTINVSKDKE